ncbi:MAG: helix-hairpin-helix domain-containing protein [Acidobacteria bacterium]|nr:helix-hairpin-helix domain-containing protein [Acidobacteriota bacterium]
MKKRSMRLAVIICLVSVWALVGATFQQTATLARNESRQGSPELLQKVCGSCHALSKVTGARRSRAQWEEVTDKMISSGAKASDDEFTAVINYLVSQYGRANVNTASASEIAEATGLSEQEAEAIVKYRKDKGKIEDFDALSKTPGVAIEKLEKSRDAISF